MKFNTSLIKDIVIEGIDMSDYPKFCDAYISSANYNGLPMNDKELDILNDDLEYSTFKYEKIWDEVIGFADTQYNNMAY